MNLREIALQANKKHANPKAAAKWMAGVLPGAMKDDPDLANEVLYAASAYAIHSARGTIRTLVKQGSDHDGDGTVAPLDFAPEPPLPAHVCKPGHMTAPKTNVVDRMRLTVTAWMDSFKVGDKGLGDCTRQELLDQISASKAQQIGWGRRERFLSQIAARLNDGERVRQKWADAEAERLAASIWNGKPESDTFDAPKPPTKARNLSQAFVV